MNEREIFSTARHIASGDERDACLHDVCAGDAEVRGRVEGLLREDDEAGRFLQSPASPRRPICAPAAMSFHHTANPDHKPHRKGQK